MSINDAKRLEDWYELTWSDGYCGRYPFVWLRDNCRCASCYYPSSKQRSVLLANLDVDIKPESEELRNGGQEFKVVWSDGHVSSFPSDWLHLNRFDQTDFDPVKKLEPKPWGSELSGNVPTFDYYQVMEDSDTLRGWLRSLVVTGLAILSNAPKEVGIIESIANRVGHVRTTMYGHTFQVEAIASSSNLAYTTKALGLHVDLPLYEYPPSVQMLHCIKQCVTEGGDSQYCDAMKISYDLRDSDPEIFQTLTTVNVDYRLHGKDFIPYHFQFARPLILIDEEGKFKYLSHNNGLRAPYINVPPEKVKHFYKCLSTLDKRFYDKENMISFKLREGDVVAFNNNRVMHGRSSFRLAQEEEEGKKTRHLEGGYLDWDIISSRIRLLDEELDNVPVL